MARLYFVEQFYQSYERFIEENTKCKKLEDKEECEKILQNLDAFIKQELNRIKENPEYGERQRINTPWFKVSLPPEWELRKLKRDIPEKIVNRVFHRRAKSRGARKLRIMYLYHPQNKMVVPIFIYTHYQYENMPPGYDIQEGIDEAKEMGEE